MAAADKKIRAVFFGTPGVFVNEKEERVHFPYRKAEGIFYYICVKKNVTRDELINIFWDECDEQTGRKNLRQALYELKKVLPDEIVVADGQNRLYLKEEAVDLSDWEKSDDELLFSGGEFLQYFYIKGASGFEDWVAERRNECVERSRNAARKKIAEAVKIRDIKSLHQTLAAWHKQELYEEYVAKEAMEAYMACGQYNMAIQIYQDYQTLIRRELEEEPSEELTGLYRRIFRLKESDTGQSMPAEKRFYCRYQEIFEISRKLDDFSSGLDALSMVIIGDAGVGKTALLTHISRMVPGSRTMYFLTHCYETEKDYHLKAFREWFKWLEKYAQEGRLAISSESREFLNRIFSDRFMPTDDLKPDLFGASTYPVWENIVIAMFREITKKRRIVLFIDDMQWMDDLSRQLLWRLMLELSDSFCFIGTYRQGEEGSNLDFLRRSERRGLVRFLKLNAFTAQETDEIIRSEIPSAGISTLSQKIFQRTEGNALFLMDLIAMIRDEGWDSASIPPQTEYVIRAKLRNITPIQRQILNALSIFMEHAELYELEILVGIDRLTLCEELEILQKHRIVKELIVGEYIAYEFEHQYYKEFVYNSQPLAKRRHMHHMVAESYEKLKNHKRWLEHLPFLIYQYEKAGESEKADEFRKKYDDESIGTVITGSIKDENSV